MGRASRRRRAGRRRRLPINTAFVNVPYDPDYEKLFIALIAGLSGFGLIPHATLEIPGSERRLNRIMGLLRRCRYSFHDLSRVQLDATPPETPRFNMPFELGLAVALRQRLRRRHKWFVLEAKAHRLSKSVSDLGGTDELLHGGTPRGVLRALTNALARSRHRPTVAELEQIYADLVTAAGAIKKSLGTDSLYSARPFKELVVAARIRGLDLIGSTRVREDILREHQRMALRLKNVNDASAAKKTPRPTQVARRPSPAPWLSGSSTS